MESHTSLSPCFGTSKNSHNFFFPYILSEIPLLQLVPPGSCPFIVHLWEEFGSAFCIISLSKVHSLISWSLWRSKNLPASQVCVCSTLPSSHISSCSCFLSSFSLYLCLRWSIPHIPVWPGWASPCCRRWEGKMPGRSEQHINTGAQTREIVPMAPLCPFEHSVGTDWLLPILQALRKATLSPFYWLSFVPLRILVLSKTRHVSPIMSPNSATT